MAVDWLRIKNDYICGGGSYRALAEKYGVPASALAKRARAEGWRALRPRQGGRDGTKPPPQTAGAPSGAGALSGAAAPFDTGALSGSTALSDTAAETAAVRARLRLTLLLGLENRARADAVDGTEFRRLVQSYKDLCELPMDSLPAQEQRGDPLSDSLRELAKELQSDDQ